METTKEVRITYETLYEIARREKNRDEMQKLPENFLNDVLGYLKQKEEIVNDSKKRFDLFSVSEREKTEAQLKNIRKLIKELYEKRESKILNMALNKSRTNTNLIDLSALLPEEKILFDALVFSLNNGREGIVHNLLQGRTPSVYKRQVGRPEVIEKKIPEPGFSTRVQDASSTLPNTSINSEVNSTNEVNATDRSTTDVAPGQTDGIQQQPRVGAGQDSIGDQTPNQEKHLNEVIPKPPQEKTKEVKFTDDVPKFVGAELEEYGPFTKDEQKTLPEEIADVLIAAGKAISI